jgi:hypothetical protein
MTDFLTGLLVDYFPRDPHSPAFAALVIVVTLLVLAAIGVALHLPPIRRARRRPDPDAPADSSEIVLDGVTIQPRQELRG